MMSVSVITETAQARSSVGLCQSIISSIVQTFEASSLVVEEALPFRPREALVGCRDLRLVHGRTCGVIHNGHDMIKFDAILNAL